MQHYELGLLEHDSSGVHLNLDFVDPVDGARSVAAGEEAGKDTAAHRAGGARRGGGRGRAQMMQRWLLTSEGLGAGRSSATRSTLP